MRDTHHTLHLPTRDTAGSTTPSGLTPNTRSEAEAALFHNTSAQTDSAAPTTPGPSLTENKDPGTVDDNNSSNFNEAQRAYHRPPGPIRTSSTNYETALQEAQQRSSASSDLSPTAADSSSTLTDKGAQVGSPISKTVPLPAPGEGVVPRHASVGSAQAEIVRKAKPSWSKQDLKHVLQGPLMSPEMGKGNEAGYDSSQP